VTETQTDLEGERIQSLDSLAQRQGRIEDKLDELLGHLKPGSKQPEDTGGAPPSVEEQVQAELARAKAEEAKAKDDEAAKAERETTATRLAKLEEHPPKPPVRRSTKLLGWGDGR